MSFSCILIALLGGVGLDLGEPKAGSELDIAHAEAEEQKRDLYLPNTKTFTTVNFTYGGGWHTGSQKSVAPVGKELQRLGYGCALMSHRHAPKDEFPAQAEDVAGAFAWVKKNNSARGGEAHTTIIVALTSALR